MLKTFHRLAVIGISLLSTASLVFLASCSGSSTKSPLLTADNTTLAEIMLHDAMDAYDRGLYSLARESFEALEQHYPFSPYSVVARLKIADSYFYSSNYPDAVSAYASFENEFPSHEAAPYANLRVASSYLKQHGGPLNNQSPLLQAEKALERHLKAYPESIFEEQVKLNLSFIEEQIQLHESKVAEFYQKQGKEKAALGRKLSGRHGNLE